MENNIHLTIPKVLELEDLNPSSLVNTTMTELVNSVIHDQTSNVVTDRVLLTKIQDISSRAESAMETYWAKRIINCEDKYVELKKFPYLENYSDLVRKELEVITSTLLSTEKPQNALVIGSGPLPLSAYELNMQANLNVDQVEISEDAYSLCQQMNDILKIQSEVTYGDGQFVTLNKKYDIILLAALAGRKLSEKQNIINNAVKYLKEDGRIVIRSSKGNRTLLYPSIQPDSLEGISLLSEFHPNDHIINSILVFRKGE